MLKRLSHVNYIKVTTLAFSSNFHIGDSKQIDAFSRTIALQREHELFIGNEGNFDNYPVFSAPVFLPAIEENVIMIQRNLNSRIHVDMIEITGITAASVFHVGSNQCFYGENRRKHIRHLKGASQNNGDDTTNDADT